MVTFDPIARVDELRDILGQLPSDLFIHLHASAKAARQVLAGGGGVYFVGNGGSAAQAEHLASELVGRFAGDRPPLRAATLTATGAIMTALVNDYPPEQLFARQVTALLSSRDMLVAISTSGRSQNVLLALKEAARIGCCRLGMTGNWYTDFVPHCDWLLAVPSTSVQRTQEVHVLLGHIWCEIVEQERLAL